MESLKFSDFSFGVTEAHFDVPHRDTKDIRLIVVDEAKNDIYCDKFLNIGNYFLDDDLLVFNDVGISPSRLHGLTENGQQFDICFLLQDVDEPQMWETIVLSEDAPPERGRFTAGGNNIEGVFLGKKLDFDGPYWVEKNQFKGYRGKVQIKESDKQLRKILNQQGKYMHPWYTNINELPRHLLNPPTATKPGAVLLSEPSRRFSPEMIDSLKKRGIETSFISLWMSFSWNQANEDTNLNDYTMNAEEFEVTEDAINSITKGIRENRRIVAIGTSPVRALESLEAPKAYKGRTDLFVTPSFEFKYCNALLTNLHNSMGTHVMMAAAFGGHELVIKACDIAAKEGFNFGINGDSMLVIGAHKPAIAGQI